MFDDIKRQLLVLAVLALFGLGAAAVFLFRLFF